MSARLFVPLVGLGNQLSAGVNEVATCLLQQGAALPSLAGENHALLGSLPALSFRCWRISRRLGTISHYALEAIAGKAVASHEAVAGL